MKDKVLEQQQREIQALKEKLAKRRPGPAPAAGGGAGGGSAGGVAEL